MSYIREYAFDHASTFTEEADKRKALKYFVDCVRSEKKVSAGLSKFVADGVEQYLDGKKPWGAKRGIKKRNQHQEMLDALPIYFEYQRIGVELLKSGKQPKPEQVRNDIADNRNISGDTVKRAIATVNKYKDTLHGRALFNAYEAWDIVQEHEKLK